MNFTQYEFVDLSHVIEDGLLTYKGLPAPIICDYLSRENSKRNYSEGTSFHIGKIEMVANTGTYIDTPFHRFENGIDVADIELRRIANLDGVVFRIASNVKAIEPDTFNGFNVEGKAVLINTNWDVNWKTNKYFEGHPFLTKSAAEFLRDSNAALVGIDSLNIDDTSDLSRPVHTTLLRAGIPIVEHMRNLNSLPVDGFSFFAVPAKVKGMGSFPVRAFALIKK
jgi:kynurenine formamidase